MDTNIIIKNLTREISTHKKWYVIEGIFFLALGTLAILLPHITTVAITFLLGSFLLLGGLAQIGIFHRFPRPWWKMLSALLFLITGLIITFTPFVGLLKLNIVIAIILLIESFFEIILALAFKPIKGWKWLIFSGIITFFLALIILMGFSTSVIFAVGLNMILYGVAILIIVFDGTKIHE